MKGPRGLEARDRDSAHRVARFGPNGQGRRDVLHSVVGQEHVVEQPRAPIPRARLKTYATEHVRAIRTPVRLLPRAIEQAVVHNQMRGRADNPYPIARRVHDALADHHVIPITPGNGVVPSVELAADDIHVPAPSLGSSPEMHPVPAAGDLHVPHIHVVADLEINGVVRGIHDGDVPDGEAAAICEGNRMRPAHAFLARRIKDLVAVDHAAAHDGDVFQATADNESPVPFSIPGLWHEGGHRRLLVKGQVGGAAQRRARSQEQGEAAGQVHGAREITARREQDLPATGPGTSDDGLVDGRGVECHPVSSGPVVEHAEDPRDRGSGGARLNRSPCRSHMGRRDQPDRARRYPKEKKAA